MTLEKALEICDAVKPNQYSRSEKIRWLSEAANDGAAGNFRLFSAVQL